MLTPLQNFVLKGLNTRSGPLNSAIKGLRSELEKMEKNTGWGNRKVGLGAVGPWSLQQCSSVMSCLP